FLYWSCSSTVFEKTLRRLIARGSSSTSPILSDISSFMERLDGRLDNLEAKMNTIDRLDVKLETMELKMESLEAEMNNIDRLDGRLDNLEVKMNTIDRLDVKLETMELKMESLEAEMNNIDGLGGRLETMEATIRSLEASFYDQFAGTKREMGEMMTRVIILTDTIEEQFSFLRSDVENSWKQLQNNTEESASKTLNAFQSVATKMNNTIFNQVQSAVKDLFPTKTCTKHGLLLYPSSKSYTVIYSSEIPGINVPFLCDTVTDGGGWIVIQRRYTGEVDFYRNWASYKKGFGSLDNDFWLGNDNIHAITSTGKFELYVDLKYNGESGYARYGMFSIDGENKNYTLHVGSYSGTAGDALAFHNGLPFSTFDQENEPHPYLKCATHFKAAWWYKDCHHSNLNGQYNGTDYYGLKWEGFAGSNGVTYSAMKIRRLTE
ncbi:hypothetical protein EGW08_018964, partial [Elysia chlorotica]